MIAVAVLGLCIGLLLGLLGGGGSILAVPALVYGAGLPLASAVPTSLLVAGISSATAVLPRLRQVRWRLAAVFGAFGAGAAFAGAVVGFLTGLFGVGGGFVAIPALVLLLGLPMTTAVPTSLVIVAVNSAAGFTAHAASGIDLDHRVAATSTATAVVGSLLSARLDGRVPAHRLRRWFAYLVFAVAALVAITALTDLST